MEFVSEAFAFLTSPAGAALLGSLFVISESLAAIPAIKANSVFQLIAQFLSKFKKTPEA